MKNYNYNIEFTDTYGKEPNYCWVHRFTVEAANMQQAITLAKQTRYYSPIPRHTVMYDDGILARINITGSCICCFISLSEDKVEGHY